MYRQTLKLIFLIGTLILISGCSNIKITNLSETSKRIDKFNSKGEFVKSYYKQFDLETNNWYLANCKNTNYSNTRGEICEFTNNSINQIRNAKKKGSPNDNEQDQSNDNEQDQSNDNEQDQSNGNEQDQSEPLPFGFGGCIGCENFND